MHYPVKEISSGPTISLIFIVQFVKVVLPSVFNLIISNKNSISLDVYYITQFDALISFVELVYIHI